MVKCGKPANVSTILVGLHAVGVIGLRDALKRANESGLTDADEIIDSILEMLSQENYVPDAQMRIYRQAIWREFLRSRNQDIREFYSEIDVTVRGEAGDQRAQFVEMLVSVFGDFELKPRIEYVPSPDNDAAPELVIGEDPVVRGNVSRQQFKSAVRKRITEW
jgi:hypothetical protein